MHPVLSSYRVPNAAKLTVYGLFQRESQTYNLGKKKNSCVVDPSRSELIRPDPTRTGPSWSGPIRSEFCTCLFCLSATQAVSVSLTFSSFVLVVWKNWWKIFTVTLFFKQFARYPSFYVLGVLPAWLKVLSRNFGVVLLKKPKNVRDSAPLRDGLCKSGLVDLPWKIDYAYFLCVARLSCTYTKTTIRLTRSFIFPEFLMIFGSPEQAFVATNVRA